MGFFDSLDVPSKLPIDWQELIGYIKQDGEDNEFLSNDPIELKGHIRKLTALLRQQIESSRKFSEPPFLFGNVVAVKNYDDKNPSAVILHGGRLMEVYLPKDKKISAGDTVKISSQTMQIVDAALAYSFGEIGFIQRVISESISEVNCINGRKVVLNGNMSGKIEPGDRVVLDSSASIILENLGKTEQRFLYSAQSDITWDHIGGQEEAKEKLKEALELPYTQKTLFEFYNRKPPRGFLLLGPPGCGKTMLIHAAANSRAKTHGKKAGNGLILIKGAQILDKFVGVAEQTLEQIFIMGEDYYKKNEIPAIIAIDEAEALLRRRGDGKSSDVNITIVTTFLSLVNDSNSIIILATNRPDMLNEAATRDKRIDHVIEIGRPDKKSGQSIAKINLKNVPLAESSTDQMADFAAAELYSPEQVLYDIVKAGGEKIPFTLTHIINGAMIAGTIDSAVSNAMKRDAGSTVYKGINKEDIKKAVRSKLKAQLLLDQTSNLVAFTKDFAESVINIEQEQVQ